MVRLLLWLAPIALLAACTSNPEQAPSNDFSPKLNSNLSPAQSSTPDTQGDALPVASSRNADGVQSDFVEGLVRLRPTSDAELQAFLSRYGGTVVGDNTIPT